MIFENAQGFNIGSWCVIAKARIYELGWHSSHGYDYQINTNSSRWSHCVVNNCAYYMYQIFKDYIPSGMVLWVWEKTGTGCAAMLHHYTAKNWKQLIDFFTGGLINMYIFNRFAPDIMVGAKSKDYYGLCETTCHELAHAMHFKKAGKDYWDNYIDGIIGCTVKSKNDIYGTSSTTHPYSGYIGVGETFGFAMGYYMANKKCNERKLGGKDYWFDVKKLLIY